MFLPLTASPDVEDKVKGPFIRMIAELSFSNSTLVDNYNKISLSPQMLDLKDVYREVCVHSVVKQFAAH